MKEADIRALFEQSKEYFHKHCLSESEVGFQQVVAECPRWADAWLYLGWTYFLATKDTLAEQVCKTAIECKPSASAFLLLGLVLERLDCAREAEKAYRSAIKLNDGDTYAWHNLGQLLFQAGRYEEVREILGDIWRVMTPNLMPIWAMYCNEMDRAEGG